MGNSNAQEGNRNGSSSAKQNTSFQVSREPVVRSKPEEDVHKYEAAHETPDHPRFEQLGELPQSYGEKTLYLIARDPHWLFTYWEIDWSGISPSSMLHGERKFLLKVTGGGSEKTIEINPEAKNWYIPVDQAGATFTVELGYYGASGEWESIVRSNEAATPADMLSEMAAYDFATVPFHLTFQRLVDMVKSTMATGESLIHALSRLQGEGRKLAFTPGSVPDWSEEQKSVLAALVGDELVNRIAMGSGEIDQLLRKQLQEKLNTESASFLSEKGRLSELLYGGESSGGPSESSLFSALGASWSAQPFSQAERGFYMHVNAEVIFYGGTHPDATVYIDGKKIALKPDGTFRHHFVFPDAGHEIPIVAISPDGVEQRSATLTLVRGTEKQGVVHDTEQPSHLGKPMGKKP